MGLNESDELRTRIEKLEAICELAPLISSSLELGTVVDRAMAAAEWIAGAESSSVWELDPEAGDLFFRFARGGVDETLRRVRIEVGEGIVGHAVSEREPILVRDATSDPRWDPEVDRASGFSTHSILCVPLTVDDRAVGAIQLLNKKGAESFTEEDLHYVELLAGQVAIALANARYYSDQIRMERLKRDLAIASSIQRGLFPVRLPTVEGYAMAGRTEACYEVGGDYYDVIPLGRGRLLLVVADVTGKGIASALLGASFRATLRSLVRMEPTLERLVEVLNLMRYEEARGSRLRLVTSFVAEVDTVRHRMRAVSAGHNPVLVAGPGGEIQRVSATSVPLGVGPELEAAAVELDLDPGSTVLAYTDGITESTRGSEQFGVERLESFLGAHVGRDPDLMLSELWEEVTRFSDGAGPSDDRTALVLARLQ